MKIITLTFVSVIFSIQIAAQNSNNSFDLQFVIEQKGKQFPVDDGFTKITLAKMPFTLYFNSLPYDTNGKKFYATQIAVTRETGDLKKIVAGINISDIPYFAPGTGNATLGPYDAFYLNGGNQYITYEEDGERRASLVSEDSGVLRLTCDVPALFDEIREEFATSNIKRFYMIVLSDMNLNGIVDAGEFRTMEIDLK